MLLDLEELLSLCLELGTLEEPFTTEEIDFVIASLPSDKALILW